jgi:hypothetical protein
MKKKRQKKSEVGNRTTNSLPGSLAPKPLGPPNHEHYQL